MDNFEIKPPLKKSEKTKESEKRARGLYNEMKSISDIPEVNESCKKDIVGLMDHYKGNIKKGTLNEEGKLVIAHEFPEQNIIVIKTYEETYWETVGEFSIGGEKMI